MLYQAILQKNLNQVKALLIEDPMRIDETDKNGVPMQFIAAQYGDFEIVRYIVEYTRANFNNTDEEGKNTLHYATMSGNLDIVKYMVEKVGLAPTSSDHNLITPFDIAHDNRYIEIETYFEKICGCELRQMYRNPVYTGMHPDPSIIRVGTDYYMVNSSFVYFPCIPISHSTDLIHWNVIGHAITNPEWAELDHLEGGRGYWAPDISYCEGYFYITATYRLNDTGPIYRKQMVVSADKPEGPYCKPNFLEEDGIDPSIFTNDDGRRYMLLNRGARIFEISKDGRKKLSEAKLLYYGDCKIAPEGPHLLKKDNWFYLFMAEGGTGMGHRITVARSSSLFGIYEPCPYNPIMHQKNENALIQRCGHGKPVQTQNGEWYMVYLCGRAIDKKYSILGRETALDPITWTPDGWPIVNQLKGPSVLQMKPNLPEYIIPNITRDHFNQTSLGMEWICPRPPEINGLTLKNSHLFIKGSIHDLNSILARNITLRRQEHFCFEMVTKMKMPILYGEQNAGLTCYYDENTYLKLGINFETGHYFLRVFEKIGEEERISLSTKILKVDNIYLKIVTYYLKREFWYSYDEKKWITLGYLDNINYLCDEGIQNGKRFTGAMIGMYAYNGNQANQLFAEFDYFDYIPM